MNAADATLGVPPDADTVALGIPAGAEIWRSSGDLREGWRITEIGVRLRNPPPRPWPWPYGILRGGRGHPIIIQIWFQTLAKSGFEYSVRGIPSSVVVISPKVTIPTSAGC